MIPKELQRLYLKVLKNSTPLQKHCCLLCDDYSFSRICYPCQQDFIRRPDHQCQRCALPLEHEAPVCGECLQHPPAFDRTFCPYLYQKPLSTLIIRYKEQRHFISGKTLADLFIKELREHYAYYQWDLPDMIIPVPLHWYKHLQRGFNQADYLAQNISRQLSIPLYRGVKKTHLSKSQKQLNRSLRIRNLAESFRIVHTTKKLDGKHIAIVDDVMTTGATANTLARLLKNNGAQHISIWAIARTPKN